MKIPPYLVLHARGEAKPKLIQDLQHNHHHHPTGHNNYSFLICQILYSLLSGNGESDHFLPSAGNGTYTSPRSNKFQHYTPLFDPVPCVAPLLCLTCGKTEQRTLNFERNGHHKTLLYYLHIKHPRWDIYIYIYIWVVSIPSFFLLNLYTYDNNNLRSVSNA